MDTITTFYGFLETVATMAIDVKNLCVKFSVLFAILTSIYGVVKFFVGYEDGRTINFKKYVWTPLILIFLLSNYAYVIDTTGAVSSILINNTPGAGDKELFKEMMKSVGQRGSNELLEDISEESLDYKNSEKGFMDKVKAATSIRLRKLGIDIMAPFRYLGKMVQFGFVKVARIIIEQARNVILGFMIIVGPLSLLFSILPVFRDVFKKWFRIYVAVLLWAVTINLLDEMVFRYQSNAVESTVVEVYESPESDVVIDNYMTNGVTSFGTESGFINFIFAVLYLAVPLLTSFFIGDKMAGGLLSMVVMKTFEYGMKAAGTAAKGATGGMGGGAGGGGGGGGMAGVK